MMTDSTIVITKSCIGLGGASSAISGAKIVAVLAHKFPIENANETNNVGNTSELTKYIILNPIASPHLQPNILTGGTHFTSGKNSKGRANIMQITNDKIHVLLVFKIFCKNPANIVDHQSEIAEIIVKK